jgi:hypothetical protein
MKKNIELEADSVKSDQIDRSNSNDTLSASTMPTNIDSVASCLWCCILYTSPNAHVFALEEIRKLKHQEYLEQLKQTKLKKSE